MPDEEQKPAITKQTAKPKVPEPEAFSEPKVRLLAPNSPWKKLHSDDSIATYALEIVGIGVIVRSESHGTNSESSVFIPNIKIADLPGCK